MVPLNGPALPAEATTVMPVFHAASTAWSSGLSDGGLGGLEARATMLSTLMP